MPAKTKKRRSSHEDGRHIIAGIAGASLAIFLGSTIYFSMISESSAAGAVYASPVADSSPIEWKKFPVDSKTHFSLVDEEGCSELTDYVAVTAPEMNPKYETFRIPLNGVPSQKTITGVDVIVCAKTNESEGSSLLYLSHRFDAGAWASAQPISMSSSAFKTVSANIPASHRKLDTSTLDVRLGSAGLAGVTVSSVRVRLRY
jgi:hypothetical protein